MIQIPGLVSPHWRPIVVRAVVTTVATTLALTAMQGSSWGQMAAEPLAATPMSQKTLTMGTAADYPPFQFKLEGSDEIQGFEIELANYIAAQLGFAIKLEDMNFEALIPALRAKRLDFAMAGITPTPERERLVDFSQVYFNARPAIVLSQGTRITEPGDFAGKAIGVQTGTIHAAQMNALAQTIANLQVKAWPTVTEMMQALQAGDVDAIILEESVAKLYAAGSPTLQVVPMLGEAQELIAIAFPPGSEYVADFNRVLQEMANNGELDRLVKKWFEQQ
ncbi:transporter substrate-binding domain-containing protein [Trichothermofontia sichuanensis B231]|uniref:transporter substrate-binding domain-containing protein n=1 Tax=Trichothermofontia sichuanensis TaxID=3045816 RepID=UPI0022464BAA|nr:transporter substrate-binding domain-containing protein [Trichothermofontia sichuanensis]UZQ52993.1 transporter substrate-binding domain-containing protein [Trichothermofontia sichuanensis B231]